MSAPNGEPAWHPTAGLFRAAVLGGLGAAVAVLWRRPDVLVLATPLLVVATWSWVRRPREPVHVRTRLGHRTLREGEATVVRTELTVPDGVDDVVVQVSPGLFTELDPPLGIQVLGAQDLGPGGSAVTSVVVRTTRWGIRPVGGVQYGAWSVWGGYRLGPATVDPVSLTTLPLPATFDPSAPLPPPEGLVGPHRSARIGGGSEFNTLRPFQPGDRLRRIHWPVSLRTGVLHVSSTYGDEDALVVLVVDAFSDLGPREGIDGRPTSLDLTVRAAGAIAEHHLGVGDRVGMRVVGAADVPRVPVGTGRPHLRRVLGTLAMIQPATERRDDGRRAIAGIGSGALVFVLSPLVDPGMVEVVARLGARGLTVVVVDTMPQHLWSGRDDPYATLAWRIRRLSRAEDVGRLTMAGVPVVPWAGPGSLDLVLRELTARGSVAAAGPPMTTGVGAPDTGQHGRGRPGARLLRLGWSQEYAAGPLFLAVVVAVAPTAFVGCLSLAGGSLSWWWLVLAPAGLVFVTRAGSVLVLLVWLLLGVVWLAIVPGPFSWWCLPAALVLLLQHTALTLLSGRPTAGGFSAETRRRTVRRCQVVAGFTVGVAVLARLVLTVAPAGQVVVVAVALAAVTAWWWWGRRQQT